MSLRESSFEWCTAAQLDGITELNHDSRVDFSKPELTRAFVKIASSLVFASEEPKGDSALISAIRRWREAERFDTHEEAEAVLRDLCGKMVDQNLEAMEVLAKRWRQACRTHYFLALFSKYDNLSVWRDYGDRFSGAVVALSTDEESELHAALPVRYQEYRAELSTLKEQVTCMLYGAQARPDKKIIDKLIVKAPDLKQQKEWRCFKHDEGPVGDLHDPAENWPKRFDFSNEKVKAVYFGPHISEQHKEAISKLDGLSGCALYQLAFSSGKYELQSHKLEK